MARNSRNNLAKKNVMLKIENYDKLLRTHVDNKWRVGKIDETSTSYLIQIMTIDGNKMQVNLERNVAGELYELWCWNKQTTVGVTNTATPKRIMLRLNMIGDLGLFLSHIEFLTRNVRNNY